MRDEPVAEAMVRCGIRRVLNDALARRSPEAMAFAAFKELLMASRFRGEG